jgi:hypothetical protein
MRLNVLLTLLILSAFIPVLAQMPVYSPPPVSMPVYRPGNDPKYSDRSLRSMNHYGSNSPSLARKSKGYVVTVAHDTIRGIIIRRHLEDLQSEVTLIDENKQKATYEAKQLAGMLINTIDGPPLKFETIQITGQTYCILRLVNGYAKLYVKYTSLQRRSNLPVLYAQKGSNPIQAFGIFDDRVISNDFRVTASAYFKDYAELAKKIRDKVYKAKDLEKIFQEYNDWHNTQPSEADETD